MSSLSPSPPYTALQVTYLILSLLGICSTWYYNLQLDEIKDFLPLCFANPATASITADIIIFTLAFWIFMYTEMTKLKMHKNFLFPIFAVLSCLIAIAFIAPLFLFLRERALMVSSASVSTSAATKKKKT
jgi:hypothetical protein